jgi:type IV pilus assembly protein PilQ
MAQFRPLLTVLSAAACSASLLQAQVPVAPKPVPVAPTGAYANPAPIDPVIETTGPAAAAVTAPPVPPYTTTPATAGVAQVDPGAAAPVTPSNASRIHEFQGDEIGLVLRSLARQAGMNIVVSDKVVGTVNMRLDNMTPRQAIDVIVRSRGLFMDEQDNVFYIKTAEERLKEPAEAASYTFAYGQAKDIQPLLDKQLASALPSQYDPRTNTIFFKETRTNMEKTLLFLSTVDRPTQQVMIEARLVEVTANPQQSYGINWAGVVGGSATPQTFKYGGSAPNPQAPSEKLFTPNNISLRNGVNPNGPLNSVQADQVSRTFQPYDFLMGAPGTSNFLSTLAGQFAILSVPQMSATLRFLNEDRDAEFLANPRVVTSNNQKAEIKITRAQPVPQLNFNEQTAQAVFSGFQDKEFGNTLVVTPVINKDNFISMNVKPEISNKVGDASFTFSGSTVVSPIIDKRTLESNVVIKSGDTLAIGGLLQDESTKGRTKVPFLGDIPGIGYLFQERLNSRTKRNLLVFVTPTIIKQGYGTGLEEQVAGVHHSGDEYADPNGWRNNAKGAVRLVPTSNRQIAADIPKPGVPPAPKKRGYVRTSVSSTTTAQ